MERKVVSKPYLNLWGYLLCDKNLPSVIFDGISIIDTSDVRIDEMTSDFAKIIDLNIPGLIILKFQSIKDGTFMDDLSFSRLCGNYLAYDYILNKPLIIIISCIPDFIKDKKRRVLKLFNDLLDKMNDEDIDKRLLIYTLMYFINRNCLFIPSSFSEAYARQVNKELLIFSSKNQKIRKYVKISNELYYHGGYIINFFIRCGFFQRIKFKILINGKKAKYFEKSIVPSIEGINLIIKFDCDLQQIEILEKIKSSKNIYGEIIAPIFYNQYDNNHKQHISAYPNYKSFIYDKSILHLYQ
jgi:hypothetical protein